MSDYGVSVSASPSAIAFASVRGSLGSPSAVAAFGHAMARHGIVVPRRRRRRLRDGVGGASEDEYRRHSVRVAAKEAGGGEGVGGRERRDGG